MARQSKGYRESLASFLRETNMTEAQLDEQLDEVAEMRIAEGKKYGPHLRFEEINTLAANGEQRLRSGFGKVAEILKRLISSEPGESEVKRQHLANCNYCRGIAGLSEHKF